MVCSLGKDAPLILTEYSSDGWAQAFSQLLYPEAKEIAEFPLTGYPCDLAEARQL
jgi:hypothetical protein